MPALWLWTLAYTNTASCVVIWFLRQIDPLIRQLTEYRDFIDLKIKEQPE